MGSTVPTTHFSTRDLPPIDRFDAWRDIISVIFDVDRIGASQPASFEASVDAYQIGNLVITDSMQGEQAYSLSPKRNRTAGIDLLQFGLYRSGGYRGEANGTLIEGNSGDVQILDLARPMHQSKRHLRWSAYFFPGNYCRKGSATLTVFMAWIFASAWVAYLQTILDCWRNGFLRWRRAMA